MDWYIVNKQFSAYALVFHFQFEGAFFGLILPADRKIIQPDMAWQWNCLCLQYVERWWDFCNTTHGDLFLWSGCSSVIRMTTDQPAHFSRESVHSAVSAIQFKHETLRLNIHSNFYTDNVVRLGTLTHRHKYISCEIYSVGTDSLCHQL